MNDVPHHFAETNLQVLRDHRGLVVGKIEHQRLTGKSIARNAQGVIVGRYDQREGLTRDASGRIVARGDVLAALVSRQ